MAQNVSFFRSSVKDQCIYEGASMICGNNTMRGNLCAYVEGETRVWTCSASDSSQECSGDDTQRECLASGYNWCCKSFETCTGRTDQVNICWAPWDNPNENRSAPDALIYNQANFPVLFNSSATEPTHAAAGSPTPEPTASETPKASNPSLSIGSIVGIGIGCGVAVVVLASGVAFLLFRRKMRDVSRASAQQAEPQRLELSNDRVAEIDDRKMTDWVSELPAGHS
ncbi:hypothetical protein DHEL01_v211784 [Diaporthe helianthi]|uniref:Uncharacterized protein n=1 Tax=Diaporthe helianthi TaxID=158607 RepID=A0A2P5HHU1_DIAHE|nr:hypothetical protein DHEL01_v211784 [Diaporthe helianthi]